MRGQSSQPLDGARLKIVRAQEHLDSLKSEVGTYINAKPYSVVIEKDGDVYTGRPVVRVEPPLRLSAIVGDCVGNARAALDYVTWELAVRYFNPPLTGRDAPWVSFPIYDSVSDPGYVNKINRFAKRQVPTAALSEITASQPSKSYNRKLWMSRREGGVS